VIGAPSGEWVYPFGLGSAASPAVSAEILGGKGASLAEMTRAGFPVPPGFTISTTCCAWADQHDGNWPPGLEEQVRSALTSLEHETQRTFGAGPRPLFVAVRSGAAVSMPGMMDTILNCGMNPLVAGCYGSTDQFWREYAEHIRAFAMSVSRLMLSAGHSLSWEQCARDRLAEFQERVGQPFPLDPWDALRLSIDAVFASWHSDRARAYRNHHRLRDVAGTAVNVQAMFPSERSGVLFTADPNAPASGEMVLEASWGLGEAVVSGAVTPDIYYINSASLETSRVVAGLRPAGEPALTSDQCREIAELGRRIETHFGVSSDIEWGLADGRVALLQTRKIRGLDIVLDSEQARQSEMRRLQKLAADEATVWVIHNLAETLPAPTPMTWDLIRWFMSAQGGYGAMYRLLGHHPRERVAGDGFLELIAGRIYVDPRRAAQFHFGRMPFEYEIDAILQDRTALDRPPTRFNLEQADSLFFFRLPVLLFNMLRGARTLRFMSKQPANRFLTRAVPSLEQYLQQARTLDLSTVPTAELIRELQRRRDFVLGEFAGESLVPGYFGGLALDRLRQLLVQLLGPAEGDLYAAQLTSGLEGDVTAEQSFLLYDIANAAGGRGKDEFITQYGHRAVNEMELAQPRWCEESNVIDKMIEQFRAAGMPVPRDRHDDQVEFRRKGEAELAGRLLAAGGSSLRPQVESAMRQAQQLLPYRELGKYHLMRGYQTLRQVLLELGRRWNLGRDVFFLQWDELDQFESLSQAAEDSIEARKLRWRSQQKLSLPEVIDSRRLDELGRHQPFSTAGDGGALTCRPIAAGTARGTARIVFDPGTVTDLGPDAVLVCPSTDPGWTPLFVNARALIVERGGVLSHGAIVARDFGIPAVVLEGATSLIAEGALLQIDANQGSVWILSSSTPAHLVPAARST
jgi:phosphohistidine swiveling domain-containing protein